MSLPLSAASLDIGEAAQRLKRGAVVAYPTEAVWGLGCDPYNQQAVERLLALKSRSVAKGLILIAGSIEQFAFLLDDLPSNLLERLTSSWPGPSTWLVPHSQRIPAWIYGDHQTVAIRVTGHPQSAALSQAFDGPLVSTSANPQGQPAAKTSEQVTAYFGRQIDGLVSGPLGDAKQPSTIRNLLSGELIRGDG